MFVFEKIPLGVTSMIVCIGLVVTGVLDIKTAFAGFIDSNVILFVAMFIVGGALFETGMANKIGGIVTHFAKSERSLIVAIMVIVGLMSGVLSNTGTAAVLIPVVIGIAAKSGYARSKLLMPLVFAAAMGGNLSLIGAPGNLIAQSALGEIGMSFGFFEYAIVGLPILAVGILFYATLGMKLLPNHPVSDDDSFSGEQDFSNVPKWKQVLSLVILVLTLLGMTTIFAFTDPTDFLSFTPIFITLFILLLRKTPRMLSAISASWVLLFAVKYVHEKNVDKEDSDADHCHPVHDLCWL